MARTRNPYAMVLSARCANAGVEVRVDARRKTVRAKKGRGSYKRQTSRSGQE